MDFLRPAGREEALAAKAGHPTAAPLAGGTGTAADQNPPGGARNVTPSAPSGAQTKSRSARGT
ncbi:hypothetical protein RKD37_002278 [Streptomyces ambofaciens]